MPLNAKEKEWIKQHLDDGDQLVLSSNRDELLDSLHDFTVSELQSNDLSPTKACIEAENIIEHVARYWED